MSSIGHLLGLFVKVDAGWLFPVLCFAIPRAVETQLEEVWLSYTRYLISWSIPYMDMNSAVILQMNPAVVMHWCPPVTRPFCITGWISQEEWLISKDTRDGVENASISESNIAVASSMGVGMMHQRMISRMKSYDMMQVFQKDSGPCKSP